MPASTLPMELLILAAVVAVVLGVVLARRRALGLRYGLAVLVTGLGGALGGDPWKKHF